MNLDLKETLIAYKECTLEIIKAIEEDNLDLLGELIEVRQNLVDEALNTSGAKEEGKKVYKELNLDELQEQLNVLISGKLEFIRSEMEIVNRSKRASNSYNKRYSNAAIFSKKI